MRSIEQKMGNGHWMPCMVLGGKYDELIKPRWWSGAAAPDQGDDSGKSQSHQIRREA